MMNKKRLIIFMMTAAVFLMSAVSSTQAQATAKTNADRKTECKENLNGNVHEYEDGGFTCNAGSYDASIHCTAGGECVCTGEDCDKIGGGGALGKIGDSKVKIFAKLSQNLTSRDKLRLQILVAKSLSALRSGDGVTSVQIIKQIRVLTRQTGTGIGGPFEDCGDHCQHLLDEGKAAEYAVCYWACVIRGGPGKGSGIRGVVRAWE